MITAKEKELVAIGIAIATGCKPCTDFHLKKGREAGASDEEIEQAMRDALSVRRGAADVMEAYGLAGLGRGGQTGDQRPSAAADRVKELVSIGAAFGVNCVTNLENHLNAAERAGVSHEDMTTVVKLASFIRGKAASHVERLAERLERPETLYEHEVTACC